MKDYAPSRNNSTGQGHAWRPVTDPPNERHVWMCTCGHEVVQAFGAAVPDELIGHPRDHGQMRGHDRDYR